MRRKIDIYLKRETSYSLFKAAFWIGIGFEMGSHIIWNIGDYIKMLTGIALG